MRGGNGPRLDEETKKKKKNENEKKVPDMFPNP
jgi:hypothetical protein